MRISRISALWAGCCGGLLCIAGCGGKDGTGPDNPIEGYIDVRFTTPSGRTEGIAMLDLSGQVISGVRAAAGFQVYAVNLGTTSVKVLVRGPLSGQKVILSACIPDIRDTRPYSDALTIDQIAATAASGYVLRTDLSAYSLDVVNPQAGSC